MATARPQTLRGRLVTPTGVVFGQLHVEGDRITHIDALDDDANTDGLPWIAPGFIDLQVNGGFGVDVARGRDAIVHLSRELPSTGVTAFLPTIISGPPSDSRTACDELLAARSLAHGAEPIGLHLEGPWIAEPRRGAHPPDAIANASWTTLHERVASRAVSLITLAPEREGVLEAIEHAVAQGVRTSLGHTDATYEQAIAAADAGATMVTHLFNAMAPLHHRAPGVVGAALDDPRLTVGLIADGIHVAASVVRITVAAKGRDGVALVTDATSAAGMPAGAYRLGQVDVTSDGTSVRLPDGTLAGSVLTLDRAVRNLVQWRAASPTDALHMASTVPARVLGLTDRGRIAPGMRSDLTVLDARLRVIATMVAGRVVFGTCP